MNTEKAVPFFMGTCDMYVSLLVKNDLVTSVQFHPAHCLQSDYTLATAANLGIVIQLC
jgi:hypothetical protein